MHIRQIQRKKGVQYQVIIRFGSITKTRVFARKFDAHRWGLAMESQIKSGNARDITFRELFAQWFENHCKVRKAPSSVRSDERNGVEILAHLGHLNVRDIRAAHIDELAARLKTKSEKSNQTVNRYLCLVQTVFNYGVRLDYLDRTPVKRDHFLPTEEIGYQYWSQGEAERFLEYVRNRYQEKQAHIALLYLIALNTGLRWGEIVALQWDAVLLEATPTQSMIVVRRSYCNVSKQVRDTTKGHKVRYVGINAVLYEALKNAKETRDQNCDFVFHTLIGSPLRISNFTQRHFKRDVKAAGVSRIRFHDLRHTYASHFMMNGGNLYDLQKILGHSDMQTTMRYAHLAREHILSKAEVVVLGKRDNVIAVDFKNKAHG